MSSALAKSRQETADLKTKNRARSTKRKTKEAGLAVMASAIAGSSISAVGCAAVDEKWADSAGNMATFGKSKVPVVPVIGFLSALAAIPLAKASPAGAAFVGWGGIQAVNIGLYQGARDKLREMYDDDD